MKRRFDRPSAEPFRPRPTSAALVAAALLLPAGTYAETIYRTIAPDGTVVFSDRPAPEATVVETTPINVIGTGAGADSSAADAGRAGGEAAADADLDAAVVPALDDERQPSPTTDPLAESGPAADEPADGQPLPPVVAAALAGVDLVVIASPPPDATLVDASGPLLVEVGTSPGSLAASNLRAEALLDGEVVASGASSMLAVPAPERGEHALQVRLIDAEGRVVVESEPQALHVRRSVASEDGAEDH